MASEVDYYDVQNMLRDARSEIRGEIADAVRELSEQLRYEANRREDQIDSLWRVLNERTAHLV